ncbi:MAG: hypothetical protein HYS57_03300 [Parcubacteria group bacterium]|nr:hypothetical protein [Parcubacteria group bacterium]
MKMIFDTLCSAVLEAGQAIESGDTSIAEVKGQGDYVTPADLKSEEIIISRIRAAHPETVLFTEETEEGTITADNWQKRPSLVIADPIDGTTNHTCGIPISAVMAAHYAYGKATCAALYDRGARRLYTCAKQNERWEMWVGEKILSPQNPRSLEKAIIGMNCGYGDNPRRNLTLIPRLLGHIGALRILGSSAIDMVFLATGVLDGLLVAGNKPFDLGPCFAFLEAAGIEPQRWSGEKATIWDTDFIAAPRELLPKLRALLFE